jgi:hypothetical protein
MAVHNASVTGSPLTPPYLAYDRAYAASPHLLGQHAPPVTEYRVPVMEQFYLRGTGRVTPPASIREYVAMVRHNAVKLVPFYLPWFVIPLAFVIPMLWRARWLPLALASLASAGLAFSVTLYEAQPHYAAPAAAAWCLLLVSSARFLAQWRWRGRGPGRALVQLVFACTVLSFVAQLAVGALHLQPTRGVAWQWQRREIERSLSRNGSHLVFVEYAPSHAPDEEWVYNAADIDSSPVVWARSLGDSADADLRRYFAARSAWRVHVDSVGGPPRLTRLGPEPSAATRRAHDDRHASR